VGVAARTVRAPDGREWQVRVYRFRLGGLLSRTRWVEASSAGLLRARLTWRTDSRHAAAVAEQVARQLELGYIRVEPHNAVFEGFADT
jgi:threonine aldolase